MTTLYTIGHGTRSAEELIVVLREAGVDGVIDVRRFPGSRRHPHFAREALERSLPSAGVGYEWWETLGGRRSSKGGSSRHSALRVVAFRGYADHMDTNEFRASLARLEAAARSRRLAIMCAETLWWRCHRRMIADALTLDGIEVVHLVGQGTSRPHVLHEAARADDAGRPTYDVGSLPLS